MKFMGQCNLGHNMNQNVLLLMCAKAKILRVTTNTIICRQDELCKNIYFVRKGRIRIVRDVPFLAPISRYYQAKGNGLVKEDPLKRKVPIEEVD